MKSFQFVGAMGLLVTVVGCAGQRSFPFFAKRDLKNSEVVERLTVEPTVTALADEEHLATVQQASIEDAPTSSQDEPTMSLVSAVTEPDVTPPSLITLPKGSDLNAQIKAASGPVVLDFYADWCGPCRTQGKILHEMEDFAAKNKTQIIKVNVDDHPEITKKLKVSSLPTLIVMKDGKVSQRVTGLTPRKQLEQWMQP